MAPSRVLQITSLNLDARMATNVDSDIVRLMGSPAKKKSKKSGVKGSVALLKESTQLGCVSQDSHPRKFILREVGRVGSNHTVKFSNGTWHHKKKGKKGSIARRQTNV